MDSTIQTLIRVEVDDNVYLRIVPNAMFTSVIFANEDDIPVSLFPFEIQQHAAEFWLPQLVEGDFVSWVQAQDTRYDTLTSFLHEHPDVQGFGDEPDVIPRSNLGPEFGDESGHPYWMLLADGRVLIAVIGEHIQ